MAKISSAAYKFAGKRIDGGRLELVSILGSGAYGVVYLAVDTLSPIDRPTWYAVKCLSKTGLDERQRKFQRREIALHQLASAHPGVVTLHRVEEEKSWIFVILDFCPDGDLFAMITERQVYLGHDALIKNAFLQVLSAVQHCHDMGIHHRDLKPENILCRNEGKTLLLADFGLATSEKKSDAFGCGSSYYMSPECQGGVYVREVPYSTRANDIWALGVILVNLTCGRNPWKEATIKDPTFRAYLSDHDFLRKILPVSIQCNDILKRVFAIQPENRMTLPELREAIINIQTFTMTEEELIASSYAIRNVIVQQQVPRSATKIPDVHVVKPKPVPAKANKKRISTQPSKISFHNAVPGSASPQPKASEEPSRVVVSPPTPVAPKASSFNSSTNDLAPVPPLSPTYPRLPRDSWGSSTSEGSLILTPEVQAVQDEPLASIPDGDLDGDWEHGNEVGQITVSYATRKLYKNGSSTKNPPAFATGTVGRNFFSTIARKIRAL